MYTDNKTGFFQYVTENTTHEEADSLMNSYEVLQKVELFFKENYNLDRNEVEVLAQNFTEKVFDSMLKEDEEKFMESFKNDPTLLITDVYQDFLTSKNFDTDVREDLKKIMYFFTNNKI